MRTAVTSTIAVERKNGKNSKKKMEGTGFALFLRRENAIAKPFLLTYFCECFKLPL
jgi:hypothetical protein